ncbi:MAG: hypothetical protein U1F43_32250 [Myxococcota bacterium]
MRVLTRHLALVAGASLFVFGACGDDKKATDTTGDTSVTPDGDTTTTTDVVPDSVEETTADTTTTPDVDTVEPTYATATFSIDDSVNQTYDATDGLAWKGSFSYDRATNVLSLNSSWGGPFVPLYDDGPAPGGHEKPGATAGDHIWTVVVKIASTDADQAFEYGAIRGSVDGADAGGSGWAATARSPHRRTRRRRSTRPASPSPVRHGGPDPRHRRVGPGANLDAAFRGVDYATVKVKGNAWGWTEVAMVDDGTKGDATAGDKKYTFRLSENLAKHDGLLKTGDKPEFIFVLDGTEYKAGGAAATAGVTASTSGDSTTWNPATVAILDSNKNSYVKIRSTRPRARSRSTSPSTTRRTRPTRRPTASRGRARSSTTRRPAS